jgi:hypothetical protein
VEVLVFLGLSVIGADVMMKMGGVLKLSSVMLIIIVEEEGTNEDVVLPIVGYAIMSVDVDESGEALAS